MHPVALGIEADPRVAAAQPKHSCFLGLGCLRLHSYRLVLPSRMIPQKGKYFYGNLSKRNGNKESLTAPFTEVEEGYGSTGLLLSERADRKKYGAGFCCSQDIVETNYPIFTINSTWLMEVSFESSYKFLRTDFSIRNPDYKTLIMTESNCLVHYDTEILPCIRTILEPDENPLIPRDCLCNKFCSVPISPAVVALDEGELFSSGDELDKLESDTDSQDTVIEGEAYKRMRKVAIKEKILLANEELFGSLSRDHSLNKLSSPSENNLPVNSDSDVISLHFLPLVDSASAMLELPFIDSVSSPESSENGSDGEEVVLSDSSSSDEATYIVPQFHFTSYKLHTIAEESSEDSSETMLLNCFYEANIIDQKPKEFFKNQSSSPDDDSGDDHAPKSKTRIKKLSQNESSLLKDDEQTTDHETIYIMEHLMMHISSSENRHQLQSPMIKELETELVRLMLTVSPASLSAGEPSSSCSSTIGSNNSDYGSDTLESAEESDSNEEPNSVQKDSETLNSEEVSTKNLADTSVEPEETLYICVQLMASLKKKIADASEIHLISEGISPRTENNSAKQYIADQIVSLMQTVSASQNSSPHFSSIHSPTLQSDSDLSQDPSDSDSPPNGGNQKSKTPSESGSETTISASISIPSYDDSDRTPTESEISHEMDELYALLETTPQDKVITSQLNQYLNNDSPFENKKTGNLEENPHYPPAFLCHGSSQLENILPISFEERIARYKDAFLVSETESEELKLMSTETLINVEIPSSENVDSSRRISNSLPLNLNSLSKTDSGRPFPITKSFDDILSTHKNTSEKYMSSKTYPPSSTHFKKHHVIHPIYVDDDYSQESTAEKEPSVEEKELLLSMIRNAKEKASSENDLLARSKTSKVFGTKSAGNIFELESTYRDTGYYSSGDSFLSLDDTLQQHPSAEAIPEEEEPKVSSNASKSSTLPLSKLASNPRTRSSFFSTSGVLRKLTLLRDDSPHGSRMRIRNRSLSGGNVYLEKEADEQPLSFLSRSHMSLSSFSGGRSESITSVYSAAGGGRYGTVTVIGEVLFGWIFNHQSCCLEISVKECRNLAPVDVKRNRSDPYVKVYLLPDRTKSGKRKTKVKKHTLNPVFDELLKFQLPFSQLEARTLWLSVWHSDRFGRNDFLGEVMLPLGNENLALKWFPLQEKLDPLDSHVSYKGDLILALRFTSIEMSPVKGFLEILIRQARSLMATRSNGTSDPFCKSYLLPDKSKGGKQKTPVIKKSCNPQWNHTFRYENLALSDLRERCLELTIWDYDKITSNDFLGGVRLCLGTGKHQGKDVDWMDSVGEEQSLWYTMLERPNTWVEGSLMLRSSMQSRRALL